MKAFRILFLYSIYFLNYAKNLLECSSIAILYKIENFQDIDTVF